jgi:hypothetical protein
MVLSNKESVIWSYDKHTKTTGLLMHYLGISIRDVKRTNYKFVDAYLGDMNNPREGNNLLLRFTPNKELIVKFDLLLKLYSGKEHYMIDDDVVVIFPIGNKYDKDVERFKNGEYSKLNKHRIEYLFGDDDIRYHICVKSEELKERLEDELGIIVTDDMELGPKPNPEKEILNYAVGRIPKGSWPDSNIS